MEEKVSNVLFYSRITLHSTTGLSLAELLQNRKLRSRLDLVKPNLEERVVGHRFNMLANMLAGIFLKWETLCMYASMEKDQSGCLDTYHKLMGWCVM